MDETFTQLPLHLDPSSKAISTAAPTPALKDELAALNALHRSLLALDASNAPHGVPPPPVPVNPKRSAQITKLRESGNAAFRKGAHADAVRMYTFGLEMALGRPGWEPVGLVREEVSGLYANRAQAHMALQGWAEGAVDALASVEMKRGGNGKAWWRRGRCLLEMGRVEEAREWVSQALEVEAGDADLLALMREVEGREGKGGRD
ncbi:MAG: hypothetical protein M1832_001571 [Thelocarpon impressellum]|nr:MAG: hypothetical protein M1832_001571 [Thelocarpon impressellum]